MIKFEVEYYEAFDVKPDGFGIKDIEVSLGKFVHEKDARAVAKGRGRFAGENGKVVKGKTSIVVYESIEDYEDGKKANLREQALNKLTAEEKEVLGLL